MGVVKEYFGAAAPAVAALELSPLLYVAYLCPVRAGRAESETPLGDWFRPADSIVS
jgi:hypothetical protein